MLTVINDSDAAVKSAITAARNLSEEQVDYAAPLFVEHLLSSDSQLGIQPWKPCWRWAFRSTAGGRTC